MTTKEIAKKWDCTPSEVQKYCKVGLIVNAFKEAKFPFKWNVPNIPKPPAKVNEFLNFFKMIETIKNGAIINFEAIGTNLDDARKIYTYLSDNGFIANLGSNSNDLNLALKEVVITESGNIIIDNLTNNNNKKQISKKTTTTASAGVNIAGIVHAEIKSERTEEDLVGAV